MSNISITKRYPLNTKIKLTGVPNQGYTFEYGYIDEPGKIYNPSDNSITLTLNQSAKVYGVFDVTGREYQNMTFNPGDNYKLYPNRKEILVYAEEGTYSDYFEAVISYNGDYKAYRDVGGYLDVIPNPINKTISVGFNRNGSTDVPSEHIILIDQNNNETKVIFREAYRYELYGSTNDTSVNSNNGEEIITLDDRKRGSLLTFEGNEYTLFSDLSETCYETERINGEVQKSITFTPRRGDRNREIHFSTKGKTTTVNITVEGDGKLQEDNTSKTLTYTYGTELKYSIKSGSGEFLGWYHNDELLGTNETLSLIMCYESPYNVVAKFSVRTSENPDETNGRTYKATIRYIDELDNVYEVREKTVSEHENSFTLELPERKRLDRVITDENSRYNGDVVGRIRGNTNVYVHTFEDSDVYVDIVYKPSIGKIRLVKN